MKRTTPIIIVLIIFIMIFFIIIFIKLPYFRETVFQHLFIVLIGSLTVLISGKNSTKIFVDNNGKYKLNSNFTGMASVMIVFYVLGIWAKPLNKIEKPFGTNSTILPIPKIHGDSSKVNKDGSLKNLFISYISTIEDDGPTIIDLTVRNTDESDAIIHEGILVVHEIIKKEFSEVGGTGPWVEMDEVKCNCVINLKSNKFQFSIREMIPKKAIDRFGIKVGLGELVRNHNQTIVKSILGGGNNSLPLNSIFVKAQLLLLFNEKDTLSSRLLEFKVKNLAPATITVSEPIILP